MIGKFGASTKLSNIITIEPKDRPISSDASSLASTSSKSSRISYNFGQLALSCLPDKLREASDLIKLDLKKIVESTHDLRFSLRNENNEEEVCSVESAFNVHKAFIAERCDYFKTFLHDPFQEIKTNGEDSSTKIAKHKSISQLKLKEVSAEVFVEIMFFIYSNNFSKEKVFISILKKEKKIKIVIN